MNEYDAKNNYLKGISVAEGLDLRTDILDEMPGVIQVGSTLIILDPYDVNVESYIMEVS